MGMKDWAMEEGKTGGTGGNQLEKRPFFYAKEIGLVLAFLGAGGFLFLVRTSFFARAPKGEWEDLKIVGRLRSVKPLKTKARRRAMGLRRLRDYLFFGAVDLDGDGVPELIAAGSYGLKIFKLSSGVFQEKCEWSFGDNVSKVKIKPGDLDGDGDLDLVGGTRFAGDVGAVARLGIHPTGDFVWFNPLKQEGRNNVFSGPVFSLGHPLHVTFDFDLGDVDGDGDLDLVELKRETGKNRVVFLLNDGKGCFRRNNGLTLSLGGDEANCLALGDADGDGDPDLFIGMDGPNRLYLNTGEGNFARAGEGAWPAGRENTLAIALGDINRDGLLDIVEGNGGVFFEEGYPELCLDKQERNKIYFGEKGGRFVLSEESLKPFPSDCTIDVLLKDLDGDGCLDLFFFNLVSSRDYSGPSIIFYNDGNGIFRRKYDNFRSNPVCGAALDFNRDGFPDLVLGERWCVNVFEGRGKDGFLPVW